MKRTTCRKQNRVTRRKSRSSRKKCKRHQYTKRGGDKPATMSDSLLDSFPAMAKFPSCGTCLNAIEKSSYEKNSLRKKNSPTKKKTPTKKNSPTNPGVDSWNGWSTAELKELGVVGPTDTETSANLTALEDSVNFKTPSISPPKQQNPPVANKNPYGRGYNKPRGSSK